MKRILIVFAGLLFCAAAQAQTQPRKSARINQPKTVRDYFMLLPADFIRLRCNNADKKKYLASDNLLVEDTANGYLSGANCDSPGGQFVMALFRRPDNSYIIGLEIGNEMGDANKFLTYRNGKWTDVGAQIVPEFDDRKIYELPRSGTTIIVYEKTPVEGNDWDFTEAGKKLYELQWANGQFKIKK